MQPNSLIRIAGLSSKPELNDAIAIVTTRDSRHSDRCNVLILVNGEAKRLSLLEKNLLADDGPIELEGSPPELVSEYGPYFSSHPESAPLAAQYAAPMSQGSPSPRKTLTELEPVTLPIDESADLSPRAACIEAKVSGSDVPSATKVMAVIVSGRNIWHPICVAKSEMRITWKPIHTSAATKHGQPLHKSS